MVCLAPMFLFIGYVTLLTSSVDGFVAAARRPLAWCGTRCASAVETTDYSSTISEAKALLMRAAETKTESSDDVVNALLSLEKASRQRGRKEPEANELMQTKLDGAWRLVFTTGTIDTQKRTGRINYFPIKAVQSFDIVSKRISNGVFVGNTALVRFFGDLNFDVASRKLTFDFDAVYVLGLRFALNGGVSRLGAATSVESRGNETLVKQGKLPFFIWIEADDTAAIARGRGGGLAFWKKTDAIPPPKAELRSATSA